MKNVLVTILFGFSVIFNKWNLKISTINLEGKTKKVCANTSYLINSKQKHIETDELDYIEEGSTKYQYIN